MSSGIEYAGKQQLKATVAWQRAFRFALANATVFVLFSVTLFLVETHSLLTLILGPAIFFLGSSMSFVMLIRGGGVFAAFSWFTLSVGIYFGLGTVLGAVDPDPRSVHYISSMILSTDLMRIDLLNSSSVMLASVAAMPLCYTPRLPNDAHTVGYQETVELLDRLFPLMTIFAFIALALQIILFPVAENLIVRVFVSSFYLVVPYCALATGLLWTRLDKFWATLGAIVFLLALGLALLSTSKYATISILLALIGGSWMRRRTKLSVITGVLAIAAAYFVLGGITDQARLHEEYDPGRNSALARLEILADTIFVGQGEYPDTTRGPSDDDAEISLTLGRFSMAAIQGFLMDRYERNSPGTSLDDFWVAAIPRVLWPEKPIVTRFGPELYSEFWGQAAESAIAPTYSAEAYWNYGPAGLVIVSVLLGLEIGWLTRRWQIAASGSDPAFFLIAFPVALWASYVETWIAATYIGGFMTIVVLWGCTRLGLRKLPAGVLPRSFPG
jgi:hypothetical protein